MERSVCRYYFFDFFATFFAVFFTVFFGAAFFAVFFATFLTAFFVAIYVMRVLVNKIRPQHLLELKEQFGERRYLLTYIIAHKKYFYLFFINRTSGEIIIFVFTYTKSEMCVANFLISSVVAPP